jgi:hypothetical protein
MVVMKFFFRLPLPLILDELQHLLSIKLGSLSNRALLVNDLGWYAHPSVLYAGIRVVSAVGMKPPHDGRSRVRPPRVLCAVQIGRDEPIHWSRMLSLDACVATIKLYPPGGLTLLLVPLSWPNAGTSTVLVDERDPMVADGCEHLWSIEIGFVF